MHNYTLADLLWSLTLLVPIGVLLLADHNRFSAAELMTQFLACIVALFIFIVVRSDALVRRWIVIAVVSATMAVLPAICLRGNKVFVPLAATAKHENAVSQFVTTPVGGTLMAVGLALAVGTFAGICACLLTANKEVGLAAAIILYLILYIWVMFIRERLLLFF